MQHDRNSHASPSNHFGSSSGLAQFNNSSSNATSITEHDYRFPRRPEESSRHQQQHAAPFSFTSQFSDEFTTPTGQDDKLDPSVLENVAREELMRETFFPTWKDDVSGADSLDSPDEMQKKDPLATQIWRLYSKTKKQLPNQERMENLTWRMMAMSLRKRKQEDAARYVSLCHPAPAKRKKYAN
jgi:GATA-binding protein